MNGATPRKSIKPLTEGLFNIICIYILYTLYIQNTKTGNRTNPKITAPTLK
jgi:hypothetical protein